MIKLPEVFVVPGDGVKIPLPVDGILVPGVGMTMPRSVHVERRLRTGDLLEGDAAAALAAKRQAVIDEAAKAAAAEEAKNKAREAEEAKAPAAAVAQPPASAAGAAVSKLQPDAAKTEK